MVYSKQSAAFRRDKQQFFAQIPKDSKLDTKIVTIDDRVNTIDYTFLLHHKQDLEAEFTQMFTVLQQQDDENKEIFWLYCYYCASLLEAFHKAYSQNSKQAEYAKIKQKIKDHLNKVNVQEEEPGFIQSLYDSFLGGFRNLISSPLHASKIRDYVAYSNLCRIYWTFCRLTLTNGLSLARDLKIIEKLDAILGTHTDVDKIISTLQAPTGVITYFSVGFFLMRLIIDGGMLLRHTFFPTELEKGAENGCEIHQMDYLPGPASLEAYRKSYILVHEDNQEVSLYYIPRSGKAEKLSIKENNKLKDALLKKMDKDTSSLRLNSTEVEEIITHQTGHVPEVTTAWDRFKHEFYKRHCNFANDFVWATVNLITNYNYLFNISGPAAGMITSVFLGFDVCMALYKCNLAKQEYLIKKAQYLQEIEDYNNPEKFKKMTPEQRLLHIEMLNKQLRELEINYKTQEATFYFVAAAAALLMMGFTASMLVSPPVLVVGCFFACTLAVAMYLSTGAYSKYEEKSLYLEEAQLTGKNLPVALKEYEAARNDFIFTMVKNTVMPIVLITTFAICWPAAIVLTAMYIGYEIFHAYDQHSEAKAAKQLALAAPSEEKDGYMALATPN